MSELLNSIEIDGLYIVSDDFYGTGLAGHKVIVLTKDPDTCSNNLHPHGTVRVYDYVELREYWIGPEYLTRIDELR